MIVVYSEFLLIQIALYLILSEFVQITCHLSDVHCIDTVALDVLKL